MPEPKAEKDAACPFCKGDPEALADAHQDGWRAGRDHEQRIAAESLAGEYARAAGALEHLADQVEEAAALHGELTPADVARQAGVPIPTVLALADGRDIALRSAAALLRWLGSPIPPAGSAE